MTEETFTCRDCGVPVQNWGDRCPSCKLPDLQRRAGIEPRFYAARLSSFNGNSRQIEYRETVKAFATRSGLLHGDPGVGKTFTASAIANELLLSGNTSVLYLPWRVFKTSWRSCFGEGSEFSESKLFKKWADTRHIFIDDIGDNMDGNDSYSLRAAFCDFVDLGYAYGLHRVYISNLDLKGIAQRFHRKAAERILEGNLVVLNKLDNRRMKPYDAG